MANDKPTRTEGNSLTARPNRGNREFSHVVKGAKSEAVFTSGYVKANLWGTIPNLLGSVEDNFIKQQWESQASEIFATKEDFEIWLETPNEAIEGSAPKELLSSQDGQDKVCQLLGRLEYGIMS